MSKNTVFAVIASLILLVPFLIAGGFISSILEYMLKAFLFWNSFWIPFYGFWESTLASILSGLVHGGTTTGGAVWASAYIFNKANYSTLQVTLSVVSSLLFITMAITSVYVTDFDLTPLGGFPGIVEGVAFVFGLFAGPLKVEPELS
jgi:hypothetical protein